MAYIGNTVQTQGFAPAVDYFNGDGTTVTFTLSRPVASVAQLTAVIDNVIQNPSSAFTVSGNAITFTSAPLSGTNNIWVEYTSLVTTYAAISQDPSVIGDITASGGYLAVGDFGNTYVDGTIVDYVTGNARITTGPADGLTIYNGGTSARTAMGTFDTSGNFTNNATGYTKIAVGTTGERPGTPANGMIRMNTTTGSPEWYSSNAAAWVPFSEGLPYAVSYLFVAGGGGGGSSGGGGGGGGAGGLLSGTTTLSTGTTYSFTVGAGGAGATNIAGTTGVNGSNSQGLGLTAIGGGGGGGGTGAGTTGYGASGGSGGGAYGYPSGVNIGGSGTSGQGYGGGLGTSDDVSYTVSGGGGGAGSVGGNSNSSVSGDGGAGVASSITGSSVYYASGGSGGGNAGRNPGNVSAGGGGQGGPAGGGTGNSGTANTGGGGGGCGQSSAGGAGGSGVVIISVPTTSYSGSTTGSPTVTTSGSNTVIKFTSSGTYTA